MRKILINGNLGYIGPVLIKHLRRVWPDVKLIGFDSGFFAGCLTNPYFFPESGVDLQYFGDIRSFPSEILANVDVVVQLAAVSNDPMGKAFEKPTYEINEKAAVSVAKLAKKARVRNFVFASSCSVYGASGNEAKKEEDELNPQTAYAISKIECEKQLCDLADSNFTVTSLRFATACGFSPRLRLDLVLNDFVASAVASRKIEILSDGTPLRPLIHVEDMSKAIEWACQRKPDNGGENLIVNTGSNKWNYQIKELAYQVRDEIGGIDVSINDNASPDSRSYRVNFDYFKELAPDHYPSVTLREAVLDLHNGLRAIQFDDINFRNSKYIRLKALKELQNNGLISEELRWKN